MAPKPALLNRWAVRASSLLDMTLSFPLTQVEIFIILHSATILLTAFSFNNRYVIHRVFAMSADLFVRGHRNIYYSLYIHRKALGANWESHRVGLGRFSSRVAQSFPSVEATIWVLSPSVGPVV